jgi:hypothetical protein
MEASLCFRILCNVTGNVPEIDENLFVFQGTCQYGSECRFEHPARNPAPLAPVPIGEYRNAIFLLRSM